jgi:predicted nucleotidyltransferase
MSARAELPAEVQQVTERLVKRLLPLFGPHLLGLYLFGSATIGAYTERVSDVDTVAVLDRDPSDSEVAALVSMHQQLVREAPEWSDRIEVDYLSAQALAEFRSHPWPAARISPGEPFHKIEIDRRWITDWFQVLNGGMAIHGPPPETFFPPIPQSEFVESVREQLPQWPDRIAAASRPGQIAYAVLTVCRGLVACRTGEHVSKKEAASWASRELPQFRGVIEEAVAFYDSSDTGKAPDREAALQLSEAVLRLV